MAKYIIEGGKPLKGKIKTGANKNAVLPAMAASILTAQPITIENVPLIRDVYVMAEILRKLGAEITGLGTSKLTITVNNLKDTSPSKELTDKLRASVLLLGPILARYGKTSLYHPGGDVIGKRSIATHLFGFKELGAKVIENDDRYELKAKLPLQGKRIFLDEASVTGTENILMASCLSQGKTIIRNAASEPHVIFLAQMLKKMGAEIYGEGTSTITIIGKEELSGANIKIRPDHIEAGTWAIAAAATKGEVEIEEVIPEDMDIIITYLKRMNIDLFWKNNLNSEEDYGKENTLIVKNKGDLIALPKVDANIWPAFPTDLISPMIVLSTQAKGRSLIHDWMYEGRMFFVDKLIRMGGDVIISDPHRVVVNGPTSLVGREIISPDIRAGMALVIASLCASGKSSINRIELIERGYEKVEERLRALGAKIEREEE